MSKKARTAVYAPDLRVEAYRLEGITQPFPNHFHECYVIGFIENGERKLSCKNKKYLVKKGDTILFNPGDTHSCSPINEGILDYRGINISKTVMRALVQDVTGKQELPDFSTAVIYDEEISCHLRPLHEMIMKKSGGFRKEENLLLLLATLTHRYGQPFARRNPECRSEIERACFFIKQHFAEHIELDQICRYAGMSKSTLLRAFTRTKGVTPYRYLENVRISEAKKLLENGTLPIEAAILTGFSDQSHFTNYFTRFIGLSPGIYRKIFLNKNISR